MAENCVLFAGVLHRRGAMAEQARGVDLRGHVGEHELDGLEVGDRLAERLALLRVIARRFVRAAGDADGQRADGDAAAVEHFMASMNP
jgi:hypothetical protein